MEDLVLHLDYRQKVPFAEQIQNQLRLLIQQGRLRPNDQLPAVRQLAFQLKINFNTVARAYRGLDIEGWITTQQGRGTYVLEQPPGVVQLVEEAAAESQQEDDQEREATDQQESDRSPGAEELDVTEPEVETIDKTNQLPIPSIKETPFVETNRVTAAQSEWIEHTLTEADQLDITLEQLREAIDQRIQAQVRKDSPARAMRPARIHKKQSRKPLYQHIEISDLLAWQTSQVEPGQVYRKKSSRRKR